MPFYRVEFLIFFVVLLGLLRLVRSGPGRKAVLLAASWYFYAWWDWRFLFLLLAGTLTDYAIGLALGPRGERASGRRTLLLLAALVIDLGLLGYFKYAGFFLANLGLNQAGSMALILPLGISFQTFMRLSYVIDVHQGRMEPERSLTDFALFTAFFPSITAGPINRARDLLPQFKRPVRPTRENLALGFRLLCLGLFKKVFVADRLGLFVDTVFANPGLFDGPTAWLAAAAYTLQIYLDFSGYSDMAIGAARCLGYELRPNFDYPYLSRTLSEFWRRWHISLSFWFRDYVYIPLGGSRRGLTRTILNLLVTMLLCGLWHGAGWTFVFWGGLHGLGLAVQRFWRDALRPRLRLGPMPSWPARVLTMLLVVVGWVFFRAPTFGHAWELLGQMFLLKPGVSWQHPFVWAALAGTAAVHLARVRKGPAFDPCPIRAWYAPALLLSLVWLVILFFPQGFNPFLYARF